MPDPTPHEPTEKTRSEVKLLTSFGNTQTQIATYLEIDDKTLRKYYRRELDTAAMEANAQVAKRLFQKAVINDDLSAQIFWLKTRARWRDRDNDPADDDNSKDEEIKNLRAELDAKNKKDY